MMFRTIRFFGRAALQGVLIVACASSQSAIAPSALQAAPPADLAEVARADVGAAQRPLRDEDLICVVGNEHILAGDLLVYVEPVMEENRKRISPSQEELVRQQLIRQYLTQYVPVKALYLEFFRDTAGKGSPADMKEAQQKILSKANKIFYEKQVPTLLKSNKVSDLRALEEKLRERSMSVNTLRQQFVESVLAREVENRNVPEDVEIGRDELIKYYDEHMDDWQKTGRAKWRQLTARFDRYPDKAAARAAIVEMGNEIYLGGKPFAAVAKEKSQGISADEGGVFDWTTQGALKSTKLDAAIFMIPPGLLSEIIEDDIGFHIIEVLEREKAHTVSFEEAQADIREVLAEKKKAELREAFHKKVMDRTVIWTRWPEDFPGSRSLNEVLEE